MWWLSTGSSQSRDLTRVLLALRVLQGPSASSVACGDAAVWRVRASSKLCSVAQRHHTTLRGHGVVCIAAPRFVSFEEHFRAPGDMSHE